MAGSDEIDNLFQQAGMTPGPNSPRPQQQPPQQRAVPRPPAPSPTAGLGAGVGQPSMPARHLQPSSQSQVAPQGAAATLTAGAKPPALPAFDSGATQTDAQQDIALIEGVHVRVQVLLGRTKLTVEDILKLGSGSVVELDRLAGEPLDILVNDKLVARGEVLVLNDNFCVRVTEILKPEAA